MASDLHDAIAGAETPRDLLIIGKRAADRVHDLEAEVARLKLYRDEAAVLSGEVERLQLDLARMTDAFGLARRRGDAAEAELAQLKQQRAAETNPGGRCLQCGQWVRDWKEHDRWHEVNRG